MITEGNKEAVVHSTDKTNTDIINAYTQQN